MAVIDYQILQIARDLFGNDRDVDFLKRVYDTPDNIYKDRLLAIDFTNKENVLDAGCGFGQWTVALARLNTNIKAIDVDSKRIKIASEISNRLNIHNIKYLQSSIDSTPFEDNFFDAVFSYSVIFFTDYIKTFKEISRVLKPGGRFYFCVNDLGWYIYNLIDIHKPSSDFDPRQMAINAINNTIQYYAKSVDYKSGEQIAMPLNIVEKEIQNCGFKVIDIKGEGKINLNVGNVPKSFFAEEKYGLPSVYEVLCEKQ